MKSVQKNENLGTQIFFTDTFQEAPIGKVKIFKLWNQGHRLERLMKQRSDHLTRLVSSHPPNNPSFETDSKPLLTWDLETTPSHWVRLIFKGETRSTQTQVEKGVA